LAPPELEAAPIFAEGPCFPLQVCQEVQRNLEAGIYRGGVLSPKHEAGVAWFQDRIVAAHGLPKPPKLAAMG